jgi:hypothetical protein
MITNHTEVQMKRIMLVLAIFTLIVPAVANAQSFGDRNRTAAALSSPLGQIISQAIAGLAGGRYQGFVNAPYQNRYANRYLGPPVNTSRFDRSFDRGYQNGYAQGLAEGRSNARWSQNRYAYPQGSRNGYDRNYDGYQRGVQGSWRGY